MSLEICQNFAKAFRALDVNTRKPRKVLNPTMEKQKEWSTWSLFLFFVDKSTSYWYAPTSSFQGGYDAKFRNL